MSGGLETTWGFLAKTKNDAAVRALLPMLDCATAEIQHGSIRALLNRRSPSGQRELLRRWHGMDEKCKQTVRETSARMSNALRDAVLGTDPKTVSNGCAAAVFLEEYDLIPALVNAAEDDGNPHADLAAATLLQLTHSFYEHLSQPRDYNHRRDPQLLRKHIVSSLDQSAVRFVHHRRVEIIEAFLMLAPRDNATLKSILKDPHHASYLAIVDTLTHSTRPGVIRLVLSFLDDADTPSTGIQLLARRTDEKFLTHLFKKIGFEPSATATVNLKRIETIAWVRENLSMLAEMDDACQHAAVQMVTTSGMNRLDAFELIRHVLKNGNDGGRRAAAAALAEFKGVNANQLVENALQDPDPQVIANAVLQLRERGIPGALAQLLGFVESPHELVRRAARSCLGEFTIQRFLSSFETLEEDVRRSTGALVKKVDPTAAAELAGEISCGMRTRRLRALEAVQALGVGPELQDVLIEMLDDDDHMIRAGAARAMDSCDTPDAQAALQEMLLDRSTVVQEAAEDSLLRMEELNDLQKSPNDMEESTSA